MPRYKRGSGSIYKRGGTFWLKYYVNGKPVYESAKTSDRGEARQKLNTLLGKLAEGRYVGPAADRVTFDELAAALLQEYEINGRKSLYWVRIKVNKHVLPFFQGKLAHKISPADIQTFVAKRQGEGASNGEINRELALLRRAYKLGIEAERIYRMPTIRMLEERNVRQGFFEQAEFEKLLAKLPGYLRGPMTFAHYTGWRWRSEIMTLRWAQVDLEAGTVRLLPGTTKNGEGRIIMLSRRFANCLRRSRRSA